MAVLPPARRRTFFAAICCVAFVAWAGSSPAPADDARTPPDGLRVFYTGHSFHMFVPPRVEQFVASAGIQGHKLVGAQGIGGSRVIQHWDLADEKNKAKAALISGEVDVFTMAAHVAIPDEGITKQSELFRDLIGHGGPHIQTLAAYCNYVAIYRTNPEGLQTPPQGVDAAQEAILQGLAWETVSEYRYAGVPRKETHARHNPSGP